MANTRPDPDPPIAPMPSARQATTDDNRDRLRKIDGGGPRTSPKDRNPLKGIPHPNSPYE